jgi:hypothetical protein
MMIALFAAMALLTAGAAMSPSSRSSGGEDAAATGRNLPVERLLRRFIGASLLAASLFLALLWPACGGGGLYVRSGGTPAGTYALTITATAGNVSHSTTVKLTVR